MLLYGLIFSKKLNKLHINFWFIYLTDKTLPGFLIFEIIDRKKSKQKIPESLNSLIVISKI